MRDVPQGIDRAFIQQVTAEQLGETAAEICYLHISGWKAHGAYRLLITTESGRSWSLIYKNAIYGQSVIPAVKGLPVNPGPPEYHVFKFGPRTSLVTYLPKVHLCEEVAPLRHYRYLVEDLRPLYRPIDSPRDILTTAAELPALHRALQECAAHIGQKPFLNYRDPYFPALVRYARTSLSRYSQQIEAAPVLEVLEIGDGLLDLYHRIRPEQEVGPYPVHGDFNQSNVHLDIDNATRYKLVDWEWAGIGRPHADYVSLLKQKDEETVRAGLESLSVAYPEIAAEDHWRLFRWSQIERGLLDGSFLAKQHVEGVDRIAWVPGFIKAAMEMVLHAYHELA